MEFSQFMQAETLAKEKEDQPLVKYDKSALRTLMRTLETLFLSEQCVCCPWHAPYFFLFFSKGFFVGSHEAPFLEKQICSDNCLICLCCCMTVARGGGGQL